MPKTTEKVYELDGVRFDTQILKALEHIMESNSATAKNVIAESVLLLNSIENEELQNIPRNFFAYIADLYFLLDKIEKFNKEGEVSNG